MNYKIDINSNTPIYIQLYEQLKKDIVNGVYPYNSKLPSKRTFKDELNISLITIEHTLDLLIEEGYIESKEKSGYFVIFQKGIVLENIETRNKFKLPNENLDNEGFSAGILSKAMRKNILNFGNSIFEKSPNKGNLLLRNEIAAYLKRSRSIDVDVDQIIIGAGAEYLYGLIAQMFSHESTIAIENPSYITIEKVYKAFNKNVLKIELVSDGINLNDLFSTSANLIHVTPFHSYPSGISTSASKKHQLINWANVNKYIIEDNYDSELTISRKNEDSLFMLSKFDNVIYLNTFSKTISPSLRIGYMILPRRLLKIYDEKIGFYSCSVSTYTQLLVAELINNGDYERHINKVRRKQRKMLSINKIN